MADKQKAEDPEKMSCGESFKRLAKYHWRGAYFVFSLLAFSPLLFVQPYPPYRCLYVICIMASYWVVEIIPIYITALIPIVAFPLTGILTTEQVCKCFCKDAVLLFFASLAVAAAIEHCSLHKRIALRVILLVGCSIKKLHFSLMAVTGFISMWLSNSATVALMTPICDALLNELAAQGMLIRTLGEVKSTNDDSPSDTCMAFYLGVTYAASIGGTATLIGTGTNIVFRSLYETRFPDGEPMDFARFMAFSTPQAILDLIVVIFYLQWFYMGIQLRKKSKEEQELDKKIEQTAFKVVSDRYKALGPMNCHEIQVAMIFIAMVMGMVFRVDSFVPGWSQLFEVHVRDSFPTCAAALLLFLLPANYYFLRVLCEKRVSPFNTNQALITWKFLVGRLSWGLLFLMGGGLSLSDALKASGLAVHIADAFTFMKELPHSLIMFLAIFSSLVFTTITLNKAVCSIYSPVLFEIAVVSKVHPAYASFPSLLAISMAFLLPVSTAPNAIVAAAGNIRATQMLIGGLGPTIIVGFLIFVNSMWLGPLVFPGFHSFPDWATSNSTQNTNVFGIESIP